MEVGKEKLPLADQPVLPLDGLFDLNDGLRLSVNLLDGRQHGGAVGFVFLVRISTTGAGAVLDVNGVAAAAEGAGHGGGERNAVLVVLNFFGATDDHGVVVGIG